LKIVVRSPRNGALFERKSGERNVDADAIGSLK
jgi:hypothetical protein